MILEQFRRISKTIILVKWIITSSLGNKTKNISERTYIFAIFFQKKKKKKKKKNFTFLDNIEKKDSEKLN